MREDVRKAWEWSNKFLFSISNILEKHFKGLTFVAPPQLDLKNCTDYIVTSNELKIACRIRDIPYFYKYGDFTIRNKRLSGTKTEWEKIKEGFGNFYFYGWGIPPNVIYYQIIDLNILRYPENVKIIDEIDNNQKYNKDHMTGFISIPRTTLEQFGCIKYTNY